MTDTDTRPSLVNMQKLERELGRSPDEYGKRGYTQRTPLQTIAVELKKLTWDDAVHLGTVLSKHLDGIEGLKAITAVQHAADDLMKETDQ